MAIISANLQFNRGGHGLLDYSSLQANYSAALAWAKDVNSNAAVGQFIYLAEAETIGEVEYAKGPYVVDAIGEGAVLTPLSKSVAGEQDLSGAVTDLKGDVGTLTSGLATTDSSVNALEEKVNALPENFVTDVKDASGNSIVVDGVATLADYATKTDLENAIGGVDLSDLATKEEVSTGLAAKADASTVYTKDEVDQAISDVKDEVVAQIPEAPFQSVAADDKVLTLGEGGVLKSDITFGKATIDGAEYLIVSGKDGVELGKVATAEFTVDGILDDVKFSEEEGKQNILVLTFNAASGKQDIEVDFGKYVDAYSAGEGLTLSDKAFAVDFTVVERAGAAAAVKGELDSYIESNDAALAEKLDASVYNAKVEELNGAIAAKADASTVYTKDEVDTALNGKVSVEDGKSLVSDELVDKLSGMAEITSVGDNLAINEGVLEVDLSAYAKSDDVANGYVAKEDGKALSSNDFTNDYKNKLDGIAEGAEVNYIKSVGDNLAVDGAGNLTVDLTAYSTTDAMNNALAAKLDASAKINGVSFVNGEATVNAGDIALENAITRTEDGEEKNVYEATASIQSVLANLSARIDTLDPNISGEFGVSAVNAGNGIEVTGAASTPTIAVKVSATENNTVEVKTDGVYVRDMRSYWEAI